MSSHSEIVRALADTHRWIEARALLLDGSGDVFGYRETPAVSAIVRDAEAETLFVIGTPDVSVVESVLRQSPCVREVVAKEHASNLVDALPGWSRMAIFMYRLRNAERLPRVPPGAVAFLDPSVLGGLSIDAELKQELEDGAEGSPIAAAYVAGEPVAFCYAGAITESLWDVAVDTVEEHRRKGYAGLCVAHMVRHMQAQGKEPVWQAAEDNPASWRLAEKLGFEPVDELVWFRRDE